MLRGSMKVAGTRPSSLRTALLVAAAVVLVLVQSLGLMHRIAHASRGAPATMGATWAQSSASSPQAGGWLQALFGDHHHGGDCQSYDQHTHADTLKTASATVSLPCTVSVLVQTHPAWHLAAQAAGFLARGPPA